MMIDPQMPNINEIITKTISRLIVFEGIPVLFTMLGWTSTLQKIIGTGLGLIFKVITLIILNQSVLTADYYIDIKSRFFAVLVLNISHILITMGTVWSEEKAEADREKAEADREKAEADREKAEADREKADEKFHLIQIEMKEMMTAIKSMNPNKRILAEIKKKETPIPTGFSVKKEYSYDIRDFLKDKDFLKDNLSDEDISKAGTDKDFLKEEEFYYW
jgi:5'-3' exonuclease